MQNLILDVSLLVNMKVTNESIVEMIRDALVDAEFRCESLTILWPPSVPQEEMAKLLSHMWGDEDAEWPAVDLEADYDADDPGDPDRTHTITTTETEPDFEWAIALRELGLSEEYIAKFEDIPTLRITPESAVLPWSPEVDSPNPFIAVQKALLSDRDRNRKALSSEAYWVGSEESMKYLPNMLLSCLRKTESYIKTFMYQDKSKQERVKNWMDRGSKYHFPGAPNITVGVEEGAMGYNFVNTFRTTEWSPIMLSTEMIPSAKNEERLWASFSLSVIRYAYFVNNINIERRRACVSCPSQCGQLSKVGRRKRNAGCDQGSHLLPLRKARHPLRSTPHRTGDAERRVSYPIFCQVHQERVVRQPLCSGHD